MRLVFYHLAQQELSWKTLIETAATDSGLYRHHLYQQLEQWQLHPGLAAACEQVMKTSTPVEVEQTSGFKLHSLGLVNIEDNTVTPSCDLNLHRHFNDKFCSQSR